MRDLTRPPQRESQSDYFERKGYGPIPKFDPEFARQERERKESYAAGLPERISRRRLSMSRDDSRWKTCLHELGHATYLLVHNRGDAINKIFVHDSFANLASDSALAWVDVDSARIDSATRIGMLAAGLAVTAAYSVDASGAGNDLKQLKALGAIHHGMDYTDPCWAIPGREPHDLRALRQDAEHDLRPHWHFIEAGADELYARGELSGADLLRAWRRYCGGARGLKELFS